MPWLAVPLGLLAGAVMGALGGGGAILTVPVLIYLVGLDPHEATTASLVIVGVSAAVTAFAQWRRGMVRVLDALVLAAVGSIGTYAGASAAGAVSGPVLVVLLATLLAVVGALMLRTSTAEPGSADPASPDPSAPERGAGAHRSTPVTQLGRFDRLGPVAAVGVGIGLLTGFFGVGGGFAIVPALRLVLRFPMRVAVGTSLLVITLNSATALAARVTHGISLDWLMVGLFTAGSVAGGLAGGRLARRASPSLLSRGFAVLLFVLSAVMVGSAILGR